MRADPPKGFGEHDGMSGSSPMALSRKRLRGRLGTVSACAVTKTAGSADDGERDGCVGEQAAARRAEGLLVGAADPAGADDQQ